MTQLPSFSDDKFEAAREQSRILPFPTKDLLERIAEMLHTRIPFTLAACKNEVRYLRRLAEEVVEGKMFEASPGIGPLRDHFRSAAQEGSLLSGDFTQWKEGRKTIAKVKEFFAQLVRPFTKYSVDWENSKRGRAHRFGRRIDPVGSYYQGEWDNRTGLRHGVGVQVDADTTHYEGGFVDDHRTGADCVIRFPDGSRAEGSVVNGAVHGQATMFFPDGRRYTGTFDKGIIHGYGTMFEPTGRLYRGDWSKGVRCGKGEDACTDGTIYRGEFANDARHGSGVLALAGGGRLSGSWRKGVLRSIDTVELPSGAVCRGATLKVASRQGNDGGDVGCGNDFILQGTRVEVAWAETGIKAVFKEVNADTPVGSVTYRTSKGVSGSLSGEAVEGALANPPEDSAYRTTGWWSEPLLRLIQADEAFLVESKRSQSQNRSALQPASSAPAPARPRISREEDSDVGRYGAHSYYVQPTPASPGGK